METLAFFEWWDATALAALAKSNGGVFAVVQMFHLLGMAALGGMVLVADLRLLGVLLTDVPSEVVNRHTQRGFDLALLLATVSGVFMSSAVAMKLYYNDSFWAKMTAFAIGLVFVYTIRRPLLSFPHTDLSPGALRLLAITSLVIWFTVAASGRWIGFS